MTTWPWEAMEFAVPEAHLSPLPDPRWSQFILKRACLLSVSFLPAGEICREQEVGLIGKDRNESRLCHRVAPETLSPQQQSGKKPAMKTYVAASSGCPN